MVCCFVPAQKLYSKWRNSQTSRIDEIGLCETHVCIAPYRRRVDFHAWSLAKAHNELHDSQPPPKAL